MMILVILLALPTIILGGLLIRARNNEQRIAEPLRAVEAMIDRISAGDYRQQAPISGIHEIDRLAARLEYVGQQLAAEHEIMAEQEAEMQRALDGERQVARGQRRFINILSHEFRTPLTVIDSCGQILRRRAARVTEDVALERADMIRRATARIGEVMESAVQLVRMEEGETTCKPGKVALGALVREAVASAAHGSREVDIMLTPEAEKASIFVDRALAHAALTAIIDNACRYSPAGAEVRVTACIDGHRCLIKVEDEGPGIPPEDLPMVRERFWRGANSTAVPGAGTGLYMASALIDANGGLLDIISEPGVGTSVVVSLPLAQAMATEVWEVA